MTSETGSEVAEWSASKSESQRLAALKEIVNIYGFRLYPDGAKALIDRIIQSERHLCSATNLPAEDLESVLQEDILVYKVLSHSQPNAGQSHYFIHPTKNDEDELQELILGLDPEVQTYILTSNGEAYWRAGAKDLPEDYEDMLKRASDSHEIITEEAIFSSYGFEYIPESPQDIAAGFQKREGVLTPKVFKGILSTLLRHIGGKERAANYRWLRQKVEDFDRRKGYLLLRKYHNRVRSEQFPDNAHLMQYLDLCNPEENKTDTFWIISPNAIYLKLPSAIVEMDPTDSLDTLTDLDSDNLNNQ